MPVLGETKIMCAVYSEGKLIVHFLHLKIKYKAEMFGGGMYSCLWLTLKCIKNGLRDGSMVYMW